MKTKLLILSLCFLVGFSCKKQLEPIIISNTLLDTEMPQSMTLNVTTNANVTNTAPNQTYSVKFDYYLSKKGIEYSGYIGIADGSLRRHITAYWNANDMRNDILVKLNSDLSKTGIEFETLGNINISENKKNITFSLIPDPTTLPNGFDSLTYTFKVSSDYDKLYFIEDNENTYFTENEMPLHISFATSATSPYKFDYSLTKTEDKYDGTITINLPSLITKADWNANDIRDDVLSELNDNFESNSPVEFEPDGDITITDDGKTLTFSLKTTVLNTVEHERYTFSITSDNSSLKFINGTTSLGIETPSPLNFEKSADGTEYNLLFSYSLSKTESEYDGYINITGLPKHISKANWNANDIREDILDNLNNYFNEIEDFTFETVGSIDINSTTVEFSLRSNVPDFFESQTYIFVVSSQNDKLEFINGNTYLERVMPSTIDFTTSADVIVRNDLNFDYSLTKSENAYSGSINLRGPSHIEANWHANDIRDDILDNLNNYFNESRVQFVIDGNIDITDNGETVRFSLRSTVNNFFEFNTYTFEVTSPNNKLRFTHENTPPLVINLSTIENPPTGNGILGWRMDNGTWKEIAVTAALIGDYDGYHGLYSTTGVTGDSGVAHTVLPNLGAFAATDALNDAFGGYGFYFSKDEEYLPWEGYWVDKQTDTLWFDMTPLANEGYRFKEGTNPLYRMKMKITNNNGSGFYWNHHNSK